MSSYNKKNGAKALQMKPQFCKSATEFLNALRTIRDGKTHHFDDWGRDWVFRGEGAFHRYKPLLPKSWRVPKEAEKKDYLAVRAERYFLDQGFAKAVHYVFPAMPRNRLDSVLQMVANAYNEWTLVWDYADIASRMGFKVDVPKLPVPYY